MTFLLAIDPGKHACAYAGFRHGQLVNVAYESLSDAPSWGKKVDDVVVELPQQRGRLSEVRMKDLIELAFVGGQAGGRTARFINVSDWKGGAKKAPMHKRAFNKVLNPVEQLIITHCTYNQSVMHNILDAVCIGLVVLKRM